jgi:hypothetical protein
MSSPRYGDRECLELRESPGAPTRVAGAYRDEGIAHRTIRSVRGRMKVSSSESHPSYLRAVDP